MSAAVRKILAAHLDYDGNRRRFSDEDLAVLDAFVELESCECDNTHDQNDTVCRWCWQHGRRKPADPPVDPIQLTIYDEKKQHVGVVLNRPGRVDVVPYTKGSARGKVLIYVYDGVSTDEDHEPIGCFDGAESGNSGWVK